MKAERRHQLQENALAAGLSNVPEVWRKYGSYVLIGLCAILSAYLIIRWRTQSAAETARLETDALATARMQVTQIENPERQVDPPTPQNLARFMREAEEKAQQALDTVVVSNDPITAAQGYLVQGDLNWALASAVISPTASTQPAVPLEKSGEDYLKRAEAAYKNVIENGEAPVQTRAAARLALAAIAENRGQWDAARARYKEIIDDSAVSEAHRNVARRLMSGVDELQKGVPLIPTAEKPDDAPASSQPSLVGPLPPPPATQPSTAPATQPAP